MRRAALAGGCLLIVGAACADAPPSGVDAVLDALPEPAAVTTVAAPDDATTTEPTPTTAPRGSECVATRSLRPDAAAIAAAAGDPASPGGALAEIRERGVLRVGVDENTLGLSYRDPFTGEFKGFEVDLATELATRIFGGPDAAARVDLRPVVTNEKFDFVEDGLVDMTISANSMSCSRWEQVAFSSEYYTAHQRFLVRTDSPLRSFDDLDGARVCVTDPSSSIGILEDHAPQAELVKVRDRTGCLALLIEGEADAYFGHDSFQYGMIVQDRNFEPRSLLPPEVDVASHYGIAINHDRPDLVRFVNAVLAELRTDGTWAELHERHLAPIGVPPADPPPAEYRD